MASPPLTLIIAQKRYSSWSLRPWVLLARLAAQDPATFAFTEEYAAVEGVGANPRLHAVSPSGLVPALRLGNGDVVWDSLAICEWLAERAPAGAVWPAEARARAFARSAAAEMHSGFGAMRELLSMHVVMELPAPLALPARVAADVARVTALWADARARFGAPSGAGPFLCGAFGAVDAMFAPVAFRFQTYGVVPAEPAAREYLAALLADPYMRAWEREAFAEGEATAVAKYDAHLASLGAVRRTPPTA